MAAQAQEDPAPKAMLAKGDETILLVEEDEIAFDPWHAIAAHRPLGALNRARKVVLAASRQFRGGFNRCPIHEPKLRRA